MLVRSVSIIAIVIALQTLSIVNVYAQSIRDFRIENYEYIFRAHNILSGYTLKGAAISEKEYLDSLDIACSVFKKLSEDSDFRNAVRYFAKERYSKDIDEEIENLLDVFSAFVRFISFEEQHLRDNGSTPISVDQIMGDIFFLRGKLKEYQIQPDRIFDAISKAAGSTCSSASKLREDIIERRERKVFWFRVKTWTAMIGGAVLVVVDAGIAAGSLGTASPAAVLSGVAGSALVSGSVAAEILAPPNPDP